MSPLVQFCTLLFSRLILFHSYVKSWPFPTRVSHHSIVDPLGTSCWFSDAMDGGMGQCIWRAHGAWEWDRQKEQPVILCDDFFERDPRPGKEHSRIEWYQIGRAHV